MSRSRFHFVDAEGKPLDKRFEEAAEDLERTFFRLFSRLNDPAIVSDVIEESARRIVRWEARNGLVKDLKPFFLKVVRNLAKARFRKGSVSELPRSNEQLVSYAGTATHGSTASIEAWLILGEALRSVDENKKRILELHIRGYTSREIAQIVGITEANANACVSRAKAQIRAVLVATPGKLKSG